MTHAPARVHQPVLLDESVDALSPAGDDCVLDCTFGRGGHSRAILARLGPAGRLVALDRDPDALRSANDLASADPRFCIIHRSFAELAFALEEADVTTVNGVLFDLGVSSPQLDDAERGFSFRRDGPLDMRMDSSAGEPASAWLERVGRDELAATLKTLGEERFAGRIANAIVRRRSTRPFTRTGDLADTIANAVPRHERGKHPATRSFQAIRMAVNGELEQLRDGLEQALDALAPGGRLTVISFHSLEDRIVKRFMREHHRGPELPRGLPPPTDWPQPRLAAVARPRRPAQRECDDNPRARSAVLRAATVRS